MIPLMLRAPLGALFVLSLAEAAPAQCHRDRVRAPRPASAAEAREDSLLEAIRLSLRDSMTAAVGAAGIDAPAGLVLIRTDFGRTITRGDVFGGNVPDSIAGSVAARTLPLLATWPGEGPVTIQFRLGEPPPVADPVGSVVGYCMPALANREEIAPTMRQFVREHRELQGTHHTTEVRILIDRDGTAVFVVKQTSSGSPQIDRFAEEMAIRMRFTPATRNGVPHDSWVMMPISLQRY
jgi:hypothetical protein